MSTDGTYNEHVNLRIRTPPVDETEFDDTVSPTIPKQQQMLPDYFGDNHLYNYYNTAYENYQNIKKTNKSLERNDNLSFWLYTILVVVFFIIFFFKI